MVAIGVTSMLLHMQDIEWPLVCARALPTERAQLALPCLDELSDGLADRRFNEDDLLRIVAVLQSGVALGLITSILV